MIGITQKSYNERTTDFLKSSNDVLSGSIRGKRILWGLLGKVLGHFELVWR